MLNKHAKSNGNWTVIASSPITLFIVSYLCHLLVYCQINVLLHLPAFCSFYMFHEKMVENLLLVYITVVWSPNYIVMLWLLEIITNWYMVCMDMAYHWIKIYILTYTRNTHRARKPTHKSQNKRTYIQTHPYKPKQNKKYVHFHTPRM